MSNIKLFESKKVRSLWNGDEEKWYFSVVDVCEVLSGSNNPRRYWSDLKIKIVEEGANELYEKIVQLKMEAPDGKMRLTDCADTEGELSTRQIAETEKATGLDKNAKASKRGGAIAKRAKNDFEQDTGQKVITCENFLTPQLKQVKKMIKK